MMMLAMVMMTTMIVRCNRDGAAPSSSALSSCRCTLAPTCQNFNVSTFNAWAVGSFLPFLLFNISFFGLPFCTLLPL